VLDVEARHVEGALELDHRQDLVAHVDHLRAAADGPDHLGPDLERLDHRGQRQDVALLADADGHAVHDRQGERQAHLDAHAVALGRVDLDRAAERRRGLGPDLRAGLFHRRAR
jgi:hypothetical protein